MHKLQVNQIKDGLAQNLRQAIQTLALHPEEQIRVLSPGCITCELYEDFKSARNFYINSGYFELTTEQFQILQRLDRLLEAIPDEAFECFNNKCLNHPAWEIARTVEKAALNIFSWPLDAPPEFEETRPGIWKRQS